MNRIRTAIIKQKIDMFGPWDSISYGNFDALINSWPGKASYFELSLFLEADWYVIDQVFNSGYTENLIHACPGILESIDKYIKPFPVEQISFHSYDLIISLDPIPGIPRPGKTVYAYFVQEHWDDLFKLSKKTPINGYDLFLDHFNLGSDEFEVLPASISMPYPRDPIALKKLFGSAKEDLLWLDWRSITALLDQHLWDNRADMLFDNFQKSINYPCHINKEFGMGFFGFTRTPSWGCLNTYYNSLGRAKFYISVGRQTGPGQALCDAASMGCICIGSNRPCHDLVCHPACQCNNLEEARKIVQELIKRREFQKEIIEYQNKRIDSKLISRPMDLFLKAVDLKCR